jgi:sn-glycerol 3-phosphate transport system ATP-binding protein
MNLLRGRLTGNGAGDVSEGVTLKLDVRPGEAERAVMAGIRPEDVEIAPTGSGHPRLAVDAVEVLGTDSMIHGRFGGGTMTVHVAGSANVSPGDVVPLIVPQHPISLFDAGTGARID